ncbi:hypothetical protein O9K63_11985 [Janibacter cremeus]|uniref:hypothetical protein n=1 Tax=Janibacter cremeus TaxID=1285192 RepID=UPI0023FA0ADA|nr:hypothetical protein [Janibacter cremeus]WEV77307.1 hypothetical protein O9K63_11985 [Janibacter cremeus]
MATPVLAHPPTRPSAAHLLTLWTFRMVALLQAALFVLQPISIGSFLQGSWAAFDLHSVIGGLLVPLTMLTGLVGLVLAVLARRVGPGVGVAVLAVLTTVQVGLGHTRQLAVHVPLGVALVALAAWLCVWSWSGAAKGARR